MRPALLLAPLLLCLAARAQSATAELFEDRGGTFVRAGTKQGLAVGTQVALAADAQGAKPAGSGTVMELWESMARLSLDEAARKAKPRYAVLAPAAPIATGSSGLTPPPPPPGPAVLRGPPLQGRVEWGNLGRIILYNEGATPWNDCELRLPDESVYRVRHLDGRSDEGILSLKFRKEDVPANDRLMVSCDQGDAIFPFGPGRNDGKLQGHAERGNLGRIIVKNDGEADWTRCTLRLPDQTYYPLGELRAHSDEGIMPTKFKPEDVPPTTFVIVRCAEGDARFDFKGPKR